jgi:ABC-type uncharacterized transport system permease subunit
VKLTGFLEESPGHRSMARLTIAQLTLAVLALVAAAGFVAVRGVMTKSENAAPIIMALGSVILGLGAAIVGAISQRNKGVTDATQ